MAVREADPDRRTWDLMNYEVNYIHLGYRFGFDCAGTKNRDGYVAFTINVPFQLTSPDGQTTFDPEDLTTIAGALVILHRDVISVTVFGSGRLEARFAGDLSLSVDKHPQYETWESHGQGELADLTMLCSPHDVEPYRT
jgi:hypothetical protein